jgi:hypothetical protein
MAPEMAPDQSVPTESGRMNAFILPVGGRGQGNTVSLPASQAATTVVSTGVLKARAPVGDSGTCSASRCRTEKAEVKSKRGGPKSGWSQKLRVDQSPGGPKSRWNKKLQVDQSPGGPKSSGWTKVRVEQEPPGCLKKTGAHLSKDERVCLQKTRGVVLKDMSVG